MNPFYVFYMDFVNYDSSQLNPNEMIHQQSNYFSAKPVPYVSDSVPNSSLVKPPLNWSYLVSYSYYSLQTI
jgi:hypothetical protein